MGRTQQKHSAKDDADTLPYPYTVDDDDNDDATQEWLLCVYSPTAIKFFSILHQNSIIKYDSGWNILWILIVYAWCANKNALQAEITKRTAEFIEVMGERTAEAILEAQMEIGSPSITPTEIEERQYHESLDRCTAMLRCLELLTPVGDLTPEEEEVRNEAKKLEEGLDVTANLDETEAKKRDDSPETYLDETEAKKGDDSPGASMHETGANKHDDSPEAPMDEHQARSPEHPEPKAKPKAKGKARAKAKSQAKSKAKCKAKSAKGKATCEAKAKSVKPKVKDAKDTKDTKASKKRAAEELESDLSIQKKLHSVSWLMFFVFCFNVS